MIKNDGLAVGRAVAPVTTSRDGYTFDTTSRHWMLSRDLVLGLDWVDALLAEPLRAGVIAALAHYAREYSAWHAANMANRFKGLAEFSGEEGRPICRVTDAVLINYRSSLNRRTEYYLGALSGFLKAWIDLGYPGIDHSVAALLTTWRLRGNPKGVAVQIQCPHTGALSDLEYEALQQRLLDAFEESKVGLEDFILVTLFMATGRRPVQIGDLKAVDLIEGVSSDGLREFLLNVPRRKQRGRSWRADQKPVALTPEIGLALHGHIRQNEAKWLAIRPDVSREELKQLAIFPNWAALSAAIQQHEEPTAFGLIMRSEKGHRRTADISRQLRAVISGLDVPSERVGILDVQPIRLRRTVATRAAREGYGPLVIAELLDHSDDQNARVYTENVPEHVNAINEAVARQLAPLAQAFAGVLVGREADAIRGKDRASRVRADSGNGTGSCGHFGFCGALAPIACYTCKHFQPWLDGAHAEVLETLIAERKRILDLTRDQVAASINDRTIFAVTEVVRLCEERRVQTSDRQGHG